MKTQTFLFILLGIFALLALASLFLYLGSNREKLERFGKSLGRYSLLFIFIIYYLSTKTSGKDDNYVLPRTQEFMQEHHLPLIDSTMVYFFSTLRSEYFLSWSEDSIQHQSKTIDYDVFDIYSVEDSFTNKKEDLILNSIFIKANILRDSAQYYTITKLSKSQNTKVDTITKKEFDRLIKDWGLSDRIYKRFAL